MICSSLCSHECSYKISFCKTNKLICLLHIYSWVVVWITSQWKLLWQVSFHLTPPCTSLHFTQSFSFVNRQLWLIGALNNINFVIDCLLKNFAFVLKGLVGFSFDLVLRTSRTCQVNRNKYWSMSLRSLLYATTLLVIAGWCECKH